MIKVKAASAYAEQNVRFQTVSFPQKDTILNRPLIRIYIIHAVLSLLCISLPQKRSVADNGVSVLFARSRNDISSASLRSSVIVSILAEHMRACVAKEIDS